MNPFIERFLLMMFIWFVLLVVYIKLNNSPKFARWLGKLSYRSEEEVLKQEQEQKDAEEKRRRTEERKKADKE